MAYKIMLAKSTVLLDEVYKLRHKVFVEEEGLLQPTHDGRIIDRFDAYPTTSNLIVIDGDEVVGAFRLVLDSPVGTPADDYFDFRQHVPKDSQLMHSSLLCIAQDHRSTKLTTGLTLMAAYFAEVHGVFHVVAPITPMITTLLKRVGYRMVGEAFIEPHTQATMIPMVLDISIPSSKTAIFKCH
ncbi:MAG: GNAT family N-acetyltransferase [Mariprofundaceae bacterium]|nr:GNAT family N-acetyltransferase [Mariprofundaceae bacterium]